MVTSSSTICLHFKFGHCRYGEKCRLQHVSSLCEDNTCEIEHCRHRHPRQCLYFTQYGRCKFGLYCSYSHVIKADDQGYASQFKQEISNLTERISAMERHIDEKESRMKLLETEVEIIKEENAKLKVEIENRDKVFKTHIERAIEKTTEMMVNKLKSMQKEKESKTDMQLKTLEDQLSLILNATKKSSTPRSRQNMQF